MSFGHIRRIGTLAEDMEKLGLKEGPRQMVEEFLNLDHTQVIEEDQNQSDATVLAESESQGEEISEALKRVKMQRMSAGARSAARQAYRKNRVKIARVLKKKRKKASFKRRKKKFSRLKGSKSAGRRARFLMTSVDRFGSVVESLEKNVQLVTEENVQESLEMLNRLAISLAEAYEEIDDEFFHIGDDEYVDDFGEPGEEVDSDQDDDLDHMDGEIGDDFEDIFDDEDNDVEFGDDEDEEEDEEGDEEEFDEARDLRVMAEESGAAMDKLKQHVINPAQAVSVVNDMTQYISGAMRALQKLVQQIKSQYVGDGDAPEVDESPVKPEANLARVGEDDPNEQKSSPVKPGANEYVGKGGEPKDEQGSPVKPESVDSVRMGKDAYGEPRQVVNVIEGESTSLKQASEIPFRTFINLTRKKDPEDVAHIQKSFMIFVRDNGDKYSNWIGAWKGFSEAQGKKMDKIGYWIV